ncbi:carbohydrate ABC transporter permease [Mycetocola zhadangensis]|uniref:Sugar ABC transporter permease n=1 Tax=Mycetocola zhadangensis TaxID=1164595 RepID=A0A3L7J136_9MICO|nr:sugar ABC transporter permease [Mycetocola zhadangensis]RLQ84226.1 sugar ABC transporter permease [Mycetocola zhadangensis]GGE94917.1 sugar ABC transporter permease [Mycetocola zhadangensis]
MATVLLPEATPSTPAQPTASARSNRRRATRRQTWTALAFIAPSLLGFVVFYFWPTLRGIYLSFTDFDVFTDPVWVGLDNYTRLFGDETFWNSARVTVQYVLINITLQTILALALAVLIHRVTQSTFLRSVVVAPYLVANVVVALVWFWMLDYQIGIVNQGIEWLGGNAIAFFGDESWAIPTIALVNTWRHVGYTALLIFAGLQMIPKEVYEAARTEGANEWKMFWKITVPLLRPVLALVLVITMIGSFQVFDTVAVTTSGGPADATRVVQYYIFDLAFQRLDFGYASAVSVMLLLVLAVIAFIQLRLTRANESDLN